MQTAGARRDPGAGWPAMIDSLAGVSIPWSWLGVGLLGLSALLWVGPARFQVLGLVLGLLLVAAVAASPVGLDASNAWWLALGGLLFTAIVGVYPSLDVAASLGRLHGVVLGIGMVGVAASVLNSEQRLRQILLLLLLPIAGWAAIGLVATNWFGGELKGLGLGFDPIYDRLPRVPASVPYLGDPGIHPNKMAAPLAMFLPLPAAIVLFVPERRPRLLAAGVGGLALLTLALTQSRSSYLALIGALFLLLAIRERRFGVLLALFVLGLAWVVVWAAGPDSLTHYLPAPPLAGRVETEAGARTAQFTLADRIAVWKIAWTMIEDFPLTGIGFGTFPKVAKVLYSSSSFFGWGSVDQIPHAHNLVLQVAVDVGLPGLACFALLTLCLAVAAQRALVQTTSNHLRALLAGSACGLFAYYVYGLTDAIGLGEKPGTMYWVLAAVLVATARLASLQAEQARQQPAHQPAPVEAGRHQPVGARPAAAFWHRPDQALR